MRVRLNPELERRGTPDGVVLLVGLTALLTNAKRCMPHVYADGAIKETTTVPTYSAFQNLP